MGLRINTNIASLTAERNLNSSISKLNDSFQKLSTGLRINKAADDAAGLSISERLRTQTRGTEAAIRNAQDGISLLQVTEGSYSTITENLQRIRELTVQAANDTYGSTERKAICLEVNQRLEDIDRIALSAKFNNVELLSGNNTKAMLQIGANSSAATNALSVGTVLKRATITALGLSNSSSITVAANGHFSSGAACRTYLGTLDSALQKVFDKRSSIGAYESRLNSAVDSLQVSLENLTASDSRIRDVDVASETAKMAKYQVLQQAGISILSQANQTTSLALTLLRG